MINNIDIIKDRNIMLMIAILGFVHKGITHVTGSSSLLSIAVIDGDWKNAAQFFLIVISFFLGAMNGSITSSLIRIWEFS